MRACPTPCAIPPWIWPWLAPGRELRRLERGPRDLLQRDAPVGPGHLEPAVREDHVGLRGFEEARGDLLALRDDLVRSHPERGAADHGRARPHRAHPERDAVGIAVDVPHVAGIEPEALVQDLLERGLVPLALVLRAHQDRRGAARREPDLGELGLRAGRALDRVHDGEAAEPAPRACGRAPRRD
jgi:hypothetical protein